MELQIAERAIFLPPMIVGFMFFIYRGLIFTNPFTRPMTGLVTTINLISNILSSTLYATINSTHQKAVMLQAESIRLFHSMMNMMYLAILPFQEAISQFHFISRNVIILTRNFTNNIFVIFENTKDAIYSMQYSFSTTVIQTSKNMTNNIFSALQTGAENIKDFLLPQPKSILQEINLSLLILICMVLIGITYYFIQDKEMPVEAKPIEPKQVDAKGVEPVKPIEPIKEKKQSVRRRSRRI